MRVNYAKIKRDGFTFHGEYPLEEGEKVIVTLRNKGYYVRTLKDGDKIRLYIKKNPRNWYKGGIVIKIKQDVYDRFRKYCESRSIKNKYYFITSLLDNFLKKNNY